MLAMQQSPQSCLAASVLALSVSSVDALFAMVVKIKIEMDVGLRDNFGGTVRYFARAVVLWLP